MDFNAGDSAALSLLREPYPRLLHIEYLTLIHQRED